MLRLPGGKSEGVRAVAYHDHCALVSSFTKWEDFDSCEQEAVGLPADPMKRWNMHTSWINYMRGDTEFVFVILFLRFPFTPILIAYWFLFPADIRATAYIKTTPAEAWVKSTSLCTIKKSAVWWYMFTPPRNALGKCNRSWRGPSTRWVGFKKCFSAWYAVGESLSKTVRWMSCHRPTSYPALQDTRKMGKGQFRFVQRKIKMHKRWLTWRNWKCGKLL